MIKSPPLRAFVVMGLLALCIIFTVYPYWLLTEKATTKFAIYLGVLTVVSFVFGVIACSMYKSNRDTSLNEMGKIELAEHIAQGAQLWVRQWGNEDGAIAPHIDARIVASRIKARSEAKVIEAESVNGNGS
jgi:hypothetical protein